MTFPGPTVNGMPLMAFPAAPCLVGLLLLLGSAPAAAGGPRPPNDFERAYTALALDTQSHELCEKISPDAESRALFNSPGTQIYRERSRCFLYLAVSSLNPYFCRNVVEADAWLHNGSYFSEENCRQLVAQGKPFNFTVSFDHELLMTTMGYSEEDVRRRFPRHPEEPDWLRFYLDAFKHNGGDFQRRLKLLPDFSQR
ncbi:MAG: hypothetical protein HKO62_08530 [Gammaproteobacteria bacterium]|nr:hypothetical protein [Gammaproteobacteria bacterium]